MYTLAEENNEDIFSVYYNNASIVLKQQNDEIIFDGLKYTYQNVVTFPEPYVYVTDFMDSNLNQDLIYQFNHVYAESNEEILSEHILEGSELPDDTFEVVIPVAYLFEYEILNPSDFKDEHGNIMEVIPSEMISDALYIEIANRYPGRDIWIEVSEDGENGSIVQYNTTQPGHSVVI